MRKLSAIVLSVLMAGLFLGGVPLLGQGTPAPVRIADAAQFDRTVFDFGDVQLSDGPLTAEYHVKNIGTEPMVIYNVASSCGCTGVEWTREPLRPGASGTIRAVYSNDEGPYPFDKSLTVYLSVQKQPVILRLRGVSHERKLSLQEAYPVRFGPYGMKAVEIKGGNLSQGEQKSGEVTVANLGRQPVHVTFRDVSDGLSLSLSEETIAAGATAKLFFTVTADRSRWGKNRYYATPVVNGRTYKAVVAAVPEDARTAAGAEALRSDPDPTLGAGHERIGIWAVTKENFSGWSVEQVDMASRPLFEDSTVSFGRVKKGTKVSGTFSLRNTGKSTLTIYKVDSESNHLRVLSVPTLAPGAKGVIKVELDTAGLPEGETLLLLNLYTNSPHRPLVTLFLTGWIG